MTQRILARFWLLLPLSLMLWHCSGDQQVIPTQSTDTGDRYALYHFSTSICADPITVNIDGEVSGHKIATISIANSSDSLFFQIQGKNYTKLAVSYIYVGPCDHIPADKNDFPIQHTHTPGMDDEFYEFQMSLDGLGDSFCIAIVVDGINQNVGDDTGRTELEYSVAKCDDPEPQPASLGDRVWLDANMNGVQDDGEAGVGGVTVELYDCAGNLLATTTTDANGNYLFDNLDAGDYNVKFILPDGYVFTQQDAAADDVDSDADPSSGEAACTTLDEGENDLTWDAGIYQPQEEPASLGDRVWLDANMNGVQDNGEAGVSGVTVELYDCDGNLLATTTTDGNGNYLFDNLDSGDYNVKFILPGGYVFTSQDATADDVDSDADPTSGEAACTTLDAGENDLTWDAGIYQPDDDECELGHRTQTPGGWGAPPEGDNPGAYLHANFTGAFPSGLTVGCTDEHTVHFTSAQAITDYLPAGGKPTYLKRSYTDPSTNQLKNTMVSQLTALALSIGFDAYDSDFGSSDTPLENLVIVSGDFAGWTVGELFDVSSDVLGGCRDDYDESELTDALAAVNENFVDGEITGDYLTCPE